MCVQHHNDSGGRFRPYHFSSFNVTCTRGSSLGIRNYFLLAFCFIFCYAKNPREFQKKTSRKYKKELIQSSLCGQLTLKPEIQPPPAFLLIRQLRKMIDTEIFEPRFFRVQNSSSKGKKTEPPTGLQWWGGRPQSGRFTSGPFFILNIFVFISQSMLCCFLYFL